MFQRNYEARVTRLPQGLPLPIVRSRLDHTPTPSRLLQVTYSR
ncbi:hypothetical protein E2C01_069581 [Portunus trituberculatus]|uniref:Uncharacterized protein n=1 Tax=Portunus trituberculatus TaxID=210409 RepID=A0A5B7I167_PORTR|nr:hypothetical protein [Portunus trituberculatus]